MILLLFYGYGGGARERESVRERKNERERERERKRARTIDTWRWTDVWRRNVYVYSEEAKIISEEAERETRTSSWHSREQTSTNYQLLDVRLGRLRREPGGGGYGYGSGGSSSSGAAAAATADFSGGPL